MSPGVDVLDNAKGIKYDPCLLMMVLELSVRAPSIHLALRWSWVSWGPEREPLPS